MSKRKFTSDRDRTKKKIIIGSSIAVISICSVTGLHMVNSNESIRQTIFGGQGISSYADQTAEFQLNQYTLKQIDINLSSLGFGYSKQNIDNYYVENYETFFESNDPNSAITLPEKLYMYCNNKKAEDRPQYVKNEPELKDYIAESDVTESNIKLYYNAWLRAEKPNQAFDVTNINVDSTNSLKADVILADGTKKTIDAAVDGKTMQEGTVSYQQIRKFSQFFDSAIEWEQKKQQHAASEPSLSDNAVDSDGNVILDEYGQPTYKYIDTSVVTDINTANVETCYKDWIDAGRPSEVFSGTICVISEPQIQRFRKYEADKVAWQQQGDLITMPDILDYVASNEVTEGNVRNVYQAWQNAGSNQGTQMVSSNVGLAWTGTVTKSQAEKFAEYKSDKANYDKWIEWKEDRNNWLNLQKSDGFFAEKSTEGNDTTQDNRYRNFWAKIARKVLELEEVQTMDKDAYEELYRWLFAQLLDKDGNTRNIEDILKKAINEEEFTIYDVNDTSAPPLTPDDNQGGDNQGGDNQGGDNQGGDNQGGDNQGGDNQGGDNQGGDNQGGDNSGGDNPVDPEPEDTVPATFNSVTLTSPTTGIYSEGQKIQIKATFDKDVYGGKNKVKLTQDTAPKLLIKFGDNGNNREMSFESASGSNIMYSYILKEDDNGSVLLGTGDNFNGKVYNKSGYETKLTKIASSLLGNSIMADNEAPEVKTIECISPAGTYGTGEGEQSEIKIKVTFNESVYTSKNKVPIISATAPVLMVSFGSGEHKKFVFDSYSEQDKSITYKYTITEKDKGKLKIDSSKAFDGTKKIYDAQGNFINLEKGVALTGTEIIVNPTSPRLDLNKDELTFDLKNKQQGSELTEKLVASLISLPEGTSVEWSSDNNEVTTVDTEGTVTAKKIGQATISAKVNVSGEGAETTIIESKCKVTVKDTTKGETQVSIPNKDVNLDLNGTDEANIDAKVQLVDKDGNVIPSDQDIEYVSKDENIAKVEDGKIIAVNPGETTIIAKAEDGTESEIKVTVNNSSETEIEPTQITTEVATATIDPSKTKEFVINYSIEPTNSNKNTKVTFSSSNEEVATVDENGKVTINGEGTAVIMISTENGKNAFVTVKSLDTSKDETLKDAQNGDYNVDRNVDTADLLILLRHIAASKSESISKKHQDWIVLDKNYYLLDVNRDGVVDTSDALALQRHIAASKSETIANKNPDWKLE